MVSPYEQERSCSSFHLLRFSSDQMCVATESPFSHWGLIKQLALFIKCIALTTQSHHITAFFSHKSISNYSTGVFIELCKEIDMFSKEEDMKFAAVTKFPMKYLQNESIQSSLILIKKISLTSKQNFYYFKSEMSFKVKIKELQKNQKKLICKLIE